MHGPPTVRDGRLFVTSIDNRLHALRSADGSELWPPYQAIAEAAGLLGSASPAVEGGIVIAPFSSGEVVALRADTGRVLWIDSLATTRRTDELALLSDVRAKPVIDQNQVFAVSYAGLLAAIDVRTGQRIWERETGGLFGPWAAGAYLFFLSNQQELACLSRDTGAVYWVVQLPMFANEKKRKEPILWAGPLLAGDRLIVVSSQGKALFLSPQNGTQLLEQQLPDAVARPPIVVDGTLFVLSDSGELAAYR
jgi:outer membrane protein assembly factor BamB